MSDTSGSGLPPAGWYADPENAGQQRYWDGERWTDDRRPDTTTPPPAPPGGGTGDVSWPAAGSGAGSTGYGTTGAGGGYGGGSYGGGSYGGAPMGTRPDPWLWQSIAATLLCCLPLGIAGIVFAVQSQSAWTNGDAATAAAKAKQARTFTLISAGIGVVTILFFVASGIIGGVSGGFQ